MNGAATESLLVPLPPALWPRGPKSHICRHLAPGPQEAGRRDVSHGNLKAGNFPRAGIFSERQYKYIQWKHRLSSKPEFPPTFYCIFRFHPIERHLGGSELTDSQPDSDWLITRGDRCFAIGNRLTIRHFLNPFTFNIYRRF